MSAALVSTWALGGASRRVVLATIGASVLLAIGLDASLPDRDDSDGHDRWAVRETGKFVRRNLDSASTVAAASEARGRLAYYATRPIAVLDRPSGFDGLDYVVLDRAALATAGARRASRPPPREIELDGRPLRVVAEFGPWVLARVGATGEAVTVPDPGKSVESPEEPVKSASELRKVRSERLAEKAN